MSFLFDSIGPFDVGAYFRLDSRASAFLTSSALVAIARAVGAWPFAGWRSVCTSHLGLPTSGGIGLGGAVFGVEIPHAEVTASPAAIWWGVRFLPGSSSFFTCPHQGLSQPALGSTGKLGRQCPGSCDDDAGWYDVIVGTSPPVILSFQPGFTGAPRRAPALASSLSSTLTRFILSQHA